MLKTRVPVAFGLLSLALITGCTQPDVNPTHPVTQPEPGPTGEAAIYLPEMPTEILAKAAASRTASTFVLVISGPGMVSREESFALGGKPSAPLLITGIPVGANRTFTGRLDINGIATHEGAATIAIEKGKTARIHLRLATSKGSAMVCVEVEGYPLPAECAPELPAGNLDGCWSMDFGFNPVHGRPRLRIEQQGSRLLGVIQQSEGILDSSRGEIHGLAVEFGGDLAWSFSGKVDSLGNRISGTYVPAARFVAPAKVAMERIACPPQIQVLPTPIIMICFPDMKDRLLPIEAEAKP